MWRLLSGKVHTTDISSTRNPQIMLHGNNIFLRFFRKCFNSNIFIENYILGKFRRKVVEGYLGLATLNSSLFLNDTDYKQYLNAERHYENYVETEYLQEITDFLYKNAVHSNLRKSVVNNFQASTVNLSNHSLWRTPVNYHGLFDKSLSDETFFASEDAQTPKLSDLPLEQYDDYTTEYDDFEGEDDQENEEVFFFEDGYLHKISGFVRRTMPTSYYEGFYIYDNEDEEREDNMIELPIGDSRIYDLGDVPDQDDELLDDISDSEEEDEERAQPDNEGGGYYEDDDEDDEEYEEDEEEEEEDIPPEILIDDFFSLQGHEFGYDESTSSVNYTGTLGIEYGNPLSYSERVFDTIYDDLSDFYWLNVDSEPLSTKFRNLTDYSLVIDTSVRGRLFQQLARRLKYGRAHHFFSNYILEYMTTGYEFFFKTLTLLTLLLVFLFISFYGALATSILVGYLYLT